MTNALLEPGIVRVCDATGAVVGAGFLVGHDLVLTCAHVVARALQLGENPAQAPEGVVQVDFPCVAPGTWLPARVVFWLPPRAGSGDIAGLQLEAPRPEATQPLPLSRAEDLWEHSFRAFGFPAGHTNGVWATGRLLGRQASNWVQIEDVKGTGRRVEPGFSGTPVWDTVLGGVVGMVVAADRQDALKVAFMIPVDQIIEVWPVIADLSAELVFVSYARKDSEAVARLKNDLQALGIAIWTDQEGLKPGTLDWEEAIRKAIRSARSVLLVASPNAQQSRYVRDELSIAEMYRRPVYPLWIEGEHLIASVPLGWGGVQTIDGRGGAYASALQELANLLTAASPTVAAQGAPVQPKAPRPALDSDFEPRNPYKGLRAFTAADATDFFGRERQVAALIEVLGGQADPTRGRGRLLAVLGASGSGKSSIVMAGLLPALRRGALPGSAQWVLLERMIPGQDPIENLAMTLSTASGRSIRSVREDLEDVNARGLHLVGQQLAGSQRRTVVLFVDQFEELFTQTTEEVRRRQFINLLVAAATEVRGHVVVLLTLRADFYDRPIEYVELGQLIKDHHEVVYPMNVEDLRAVIERPAALPDVQLRFEGNLVGDLLFDLRDEASALPLLQFTLDRLFEQRQGRLLTVAAYRAIGGVRGALAQHAEQTYAQLPNDEHRRLARALFLRLIEPGVSSQEATRRRAAVAELEILDPIQAQNLRAAGQAFVDARLLTVDKNSVEISHEALIRAWPRLSAWLEEARDDIRLTKTLSADAAEWQRRGRLPYSDLLYHGTQLEEAVAWAARNPVSVAEGAFIAASVALQDAKTAEEQARSAREARIARRARQFGLAAAALAVVGMLALVATLLAVRESRNAQATIQAANASQAAAEEQAVAVAAKVQAADAQLAQSTARLKDVEADLQLGQETLQTVALAQNAQEALDEGNPPLALALALEANRSATAPPFVRQQLADFAYRPLPGRVLGEHENFVTDLAFSPDGTTLLSSAQDHSIIRWDVRSGAVVTRWLEHAAPVTAIEFSPDGTRALSAGYDRALILWDVANNASIRRMVGQHSPVAALAIAPVDEGMPLRAVSAGCRQMRFNICEEAEFIVWDLETGQPVRDFSGVAGWVRALEFSPGGDEIMSVTVNDSGIIQFWDAASGQELRRIEGDEYELISTAAYHPDGTLIAFNADNAGTVVLWDLNEGREVARLQGHTGWSAVLRFNPTGQLLLSGGMDNQVIVWDVRNRERVATYRRHTAPVTAVAFAPDGRTFATGAQDMDIFLWDVEPAVVEHRLRGHTAGIWSVDLHVDDQRAVALSGGADDTLILWNLDSGEMLSRLTGHTDRIWSVALGPQAYQAISGSDDHTMRLWDLETGQVVHTFLHDDAVLAVALSPDGKQALSSTRDRSIVLWDLSTRTEVGRLNWHVGAAHALDISADGKKALSGGVDGWVILWDLASLTFERGFDGHANVVTSVAFSPDASLIATGGLDNRVLLWDRATGELLRTYVGHTAEISAVAFSPDGKRILSSSADGSVILWDRDRDQPVRVFRLHLASVRDVVFMPDGAGALSASYDGTLALWQILDDEPASVRAWIAAHAQVPALSCIGRRESNVAPLCDEDAYYQEGAALLERFQLRRAIDAFDQALSLNPAHATAYLKRAEARRRLGLAALAIDDYRAGLARMPATVEALEGLGLTYQSVPSYTAAIEAFDQAVALSPATARTYRLRGWAYLGRARFDSQAVDAAYSDLHRALEDFDRAYALAPAEMEAPVPGDASPFYLGRGITRFFLEYQAGNLSEAIDDLEQAVKSGLSVFDLAEAYHFLGQAYLAPRGEQQGSADPQKAQESFAAVIELNPAFAGAHTKLGQVAFQNGDYAAARDAYAVAVTVEPSSIVAHVGLGQARIYLGEVEDAIASFDKALALDPDNQDALLKRAEAYLIRNDSDQGDIERALDDTDRFLGVVGTTDESRWLRANAHYLRGVAYLRQGKHEASLAALDLALDLEPEYVDALAIRVQAYLASNNEAQALADCAKLTTFPAVAISRGGITCLVTFHNAADEVRAETVANVLIEAQPETSINYLWRALARIGQSRYASALDDLNTFGRLDPSPSTQASRYLWSVVAYRLEGRAAEEADARRQAEEALARVDETALRLRLSGLLALAVGDEARALSLFEAALEENASRGEWYAAMSHVAFLGRLLPEEADIEPLARWLDTRLPAGQE